jgi:membrane fusion protein (multidrug efflux system)
LFIYRNGKAMRTEVLLGSRTDTEVQVLSGLSPGDTVLTTGLLQVKDLTQVEITEFVKPASL